MGDVDMRRSFLFVMVSLLMCGSMPAAAQARRAVRPVPDTGMAAFGVTVGASVPTEPSLQNGVDLGAQIEKYLSPRVSVRARASGAWFDVTGRGFVGTVQPVA